MTNLNRQYRPTNKFPLIFNDRQVHIYVYADTLKLLENKIILDRDFEI
jgi:hypothetical protein